MSAFFPVVSAQRPSWARFLAFCSPAPVEKYSTPSCQAAITGVTCSRPELPVQPAARRLRLLVERSWDGLDALDVVLFRLRGFSFALSKHDGNPAGISLVWLTQRHEDADKALDVLLEVIGIGEEAVAFRGDPDEEPAAQSSVTHEDAPGASRWARLRRLFGAAPSPS